MRWRSRSPRFAGTAAIAAAWRHAGSKERLPACVCAAARLARSIRCADACCTGSGSCFVCAQSMPRRWPWRSKPSPSRPRRTIPSLALAACIVHGQVDQLQGRWHAAREWTERGLARRGAGGLRAGRDLRVRSAGDAAGAARHPAPALRPGRAGARASAARARATRASCDNRWRRWPRSGTTRCSRCGSATRSELRRLRRR